LTEEGLTEECPPRRAASSGDEKGGALAYPEERADEQQGRCKCGVANPQRSVIPVVPSPSRWAT
jgi:hypothetical protein